MFRCLFAGVFFTCLSGCATTVALSTDGDLYPSGGHKAAVVGAAVVADAALTAIAGEWYYRMLWETIREK